MTATALQGFELDAGAAEFGTRMARILTRESTDTAVQDALEVVASLVLQRSQQGHAFLDFDAPVVLRRASTESEGGMEEVSFNGHRDLRGAIATVIGAPQVRGELLVLEENRLYLRRLWEDERWLAAWLQRRMSAPAAAQNANAQAASVHSVWLQPLLNAVFPPESPHEQLAAVAECVGRSFGVITGGPGTGKTFVVARLLYALAVGVALARGRAPQVMLLAPTGKAARRVDASVSAAFESARAPMEKLVRAWRDTPPMPGAAEAAELAMAALASMQGCASTIHSALETDPAGADIYRRNEKRPLAADIVVVDEASMVGMSIMRALCQAVPEGAPLFMLGDSAQLQSVDAGSVLADIATEEGATSGVWKAANLKTSRRFPSSSGLGRLAEAVRTGARSASGGMVAMELLEGDAQVRAQVALVEPAAGETTAHVLELVAAHTAKLAEPGLPPAERLAELESCAVLCAHRRGPGGADELNQRLQRRFAPARARGSAPYIGMPVLILRNHPDTGLSNGDVGVVCADDLGALVAHFDGGRKVPVPMLPEYAPAYALTVHKSQGSEYERVVLVLPERESPVLTRELIYTALTRWRATATGGVTIVGTRRVLEHALKSRVQRASGLRQRLA